MAKLPILLGAGALAVLLFGCGRTPARTTPLAHIESCEYDVSIENEQLLEVTARCRGEGIVGFRGTEPRMLPFIENVKSGEGRALTHKKGLFRFATAGSAVSYRVELGRAADAIKDYDFAERVGASVIAPASSFLLVPEPLTDTPVTIRVRNRDGSDFVTGLKPRGDEYVILAHEIPLATYSYFGRFARDSFDLPGARIEVVTLDGPLAVSAKARSEWILDSARAVADFYGRFPVPRTVVGIVPVPERDEVVFGKVLPESAPGIALLLGERANKQALYADWVLVHELFHLGFPSFDREGKWLDEGLATYFEPIIRARAGFIEEHDVWREFFYEMPYGLSSVQAGLEKAHDYRGMYWGGAIVCLLADIEARRGKPERGLEVGLRNVLEAGGDASSVWSLADAIALIDGPLSKPVVADLARAYGRLGGRVDLPAIFERLGVRSAGNDVRLDDGAPLAAVRKAIVRGH